MVSKEDILKVPGLVCFWDFQEETGEDRISKSHFKYRLIELSGAVERVEDGIFGPYSAKFCPGRWLSIPRTQCPALNIHG